MFGGEAAFVESKSLFIHYLEVLVNGRVLAKVRAAISLHVQSVEDIFPLIKATQSQTCVMVEDLQFLKPRPGLSHWLSVGSDLESAATLAAPC